MLLLDRFISEKDNLHLQSYLNDSSVVIRTSVEAACSWVYLYDGQNPSISESIRMLNEPRRKVINSIDHVTDVNNIEEAVPEVLQAKEQVDVDKLRIEGNYMTEMDLASPGQSSGYQSFNFNSRSQVHEENSFFSKEVQDDLEFWSLMREDLDSMKTLAHVSLF